MRILFLTDNFPPEVNAPASRTFDHCREWVKQGHEVTVVTCFPNFPQGRVYAGYRNIPWQVERMEGIRVVRVWTYIAANQGFARRIIDYLSYMVMATVVAPFSGKTDVVIGTSPQFFTVCAAYMVSWLKRVPFIFELRDLWPASLKAVGVRHTSTMIRLLEYIEMFLYRKAKRIITVTYAFKRTLIERGIDECKIDVVMNGVDKRCFFPRPPCALLVHRYRTEHRFIAGYIGTHGMAHALETLLEAANWLQKYAPSEPISLLLLGDGARKQSLLAQARQMQLHNVIFVDSVPKTQVADYWSLLDVCVIHLRKDPLFLTVIPSKLFECMGMGVPVVNCVAGETAQMVERDQVGVNIAAEEPELLAKTLIELKNDRIAYAVYREHCIKAASRYDRQHLAMRMQACIGAAIQ